MHAIDASSCFYLNLQSKSKVESNGKRKEMKDGGYCLTVHVNNQENGHLWQNYQPSKFALFSGTSC